MKIGMPTPSKLLIEMGEKKMTIEGEATFNKERTPQIIFYANINSIKHWEPPFDNALSEREKQLLIEEILKENLKQDFKIIFD